MKSRLCALLILYMLLNGHSVKCTAAVGQGQGTGVSTDQGVSSQHTANSAGQGIGSSTGSTGVPQSRPQSGGGDTGTQGGQQDRASGTSATHVPVVPQNGHVQSNPPPSTSSGGPNGGGGASITQNVQQANLQAGSDTQVAATPSESFTNPIQVKASLLRDQKGLKITGPCKSYFQVYLVPYLYLNVNAKESEIEMDPMFMKVDDKIKFEKEKHLLNNICEDNKTFKLVVYMYEGELTIKWKVYPPKGETSSDKTLDIRKYKMKDIGQPITSMQVVVMSELNKTIYMESKNFAVMNQIPEKCDAIANECFLSGVLDVQKCYHCTLLLQKKENAEECFKFVSPTIKNRFEDIQTKGEDEENPNVVELEETIDLLLNKIYKNGEGESNEVDQLAIIDSSFQSDLLKYCSLMKEVDTSGSLDNHQLGDAEDVFANLTHLLQSNSDHDVPSLKNKLKSPAICLKNVGHWVGSKTGLVLPTLEYSTSQDNAESFDEGEEDTSNSTTTQSADVHPLNVSDKLFCNDEYCDRAKDSSSCIAKIEAGDQGDCSTSWLFASKVHLEAIKCMKGHDHVASSALYVANCSGKEANDKCHAASNPLEFLNTLEETKFLAAESDLPYSYKAVNNACPEPKSHWKNLWENVKLLDPTNEPNSVSTKGYTAYQSDHFKGNMDAFIKLVKSEVMKKGSAIAYVKAQGALSYDLNGKKVQSLCGGETPDLAVNIVGYGNYITAEGQKKSYWLLQNSWGKHWGDDGNFKVDMHGPDHCQNNFIHTAAVFNLDVPVVAPAPSSDPEINDYYMKNSPDFFSNFYFNKYEAEKANGLGEEKGPVNNSVLYGQSGEETSALPASVGDQSGKVVAQTAEGLGAQQGSGGGLGAAAGPTGQEGVGVAAPGGRGTGGEAIAAAAVVVVGGGGSGSAGERGTGVGVAPGVGAAGRSVGEGQQLPAGAASPGTGTQHVGGSVSGGTNSGNGATGNSGPNTQRGQVSQTVNEAAPSTVEKPKSIDSTGVISEGITGVFHFLKNVKKGKVSSNFVTYDNTKAIGDKACSRVQSSDVDKLDDCVKFCEANWNECKGKVSPGYCLTKKKGNNDCFFCFV
ncbi:serine-repeat antigen 5 (SERA) [Plasmodium vivax]|uniref:Serine-repeat antigen 5 (SERA) n=2 Tax=Plasmodium vivax TaxID=5855 RepID=A5KBM8_PLAVS|nr:serine-repeat antigen 5 (SERA) [Plasmodium vivax]AAB41489.1 V-SERA 5 [Plasmodium vivax]EDL43278.1 serine-repeat antigen 5 (SERA) [Plasmodium vivax]|eukprot:XP_001613005.1 serine-repeat antigen 5 (SERA) [Plasmodium vivax Sal-1]